MTAISIEFIPTAASGFFGSTAMVSAIDESGVLQGNQPLGDLIPLLSSQRTSALHTPYSTVTKSFNYRKWVG